MESLYIKSDLGYCISMCSSDTQTFFQPCLWWNKVAQKIKQLNNWQQGEIKKLNG